MSTTIRKWGNSLGLRIPKSLAKELGLAEGKEVTLEKREGTLAIRPAKKRQPTLDELVRKITPQNRHELVDWGKPLGKEIW
jgi:antitoxin MazE